MKTSSFARCALLFAALSLPPSLRAEFTVHEWGTFTVLQGSDGQPLRWYQSRHDQHKLPGFVHPDPLMFSGFKAVAPDGFAIARMETPVLYFYPKEELDISVTASLTGGRLTEWFPNALSTGLTPGSRPGSLQWIGRLLRPDSPLKAEIPHTRDAAGKHYDAARAVPDAWIFRSSLPKPALRRDPADLNRTLPPVPEVDRLIFYRGAADIAVPLQVRTGDDRTFTIHNITDKPIAVAFALQSTTGSIAWTRMDGLQPVQWVDGKEMNVRDFVFPEPRPRAEAIAALRKAVTETLVTEGLTPAEAAAMVETWQDLWFAETGTRVLSVLPVEWADTSVPLAIDPAPQVRDRVYVLRSEILTKAREEGLADLLSRSGDPAAESASFRALELGRFSHGALARAQQMLTARQEARFHALVNAR
jgi:hypothetical protein